MISSNFSLPSLRLSVFLIRGRKYGLLEEAGEVDCALLVALTGHFDQNRSVELDGGFFSFDMHVCNIEGIPASDKA